MKVYRGIGLMSGTSLDGIDLAYCEFVERDGDWSFELLVGETIPYDEKWYARLAKLDEQSAETYARTHVYLGHLLGATVANFCKKHEIKPQFVASHGQTIFHQPGKNFTSQIGDGETFSSYLACPLVTNFRYKDVALRGQGAPLVPFGEKHLFKDYRLFLNLGGIANLTFGTLAFDVCPCNMALNWLVRSKDSSKAYDANGEWAASGKLIPEMYRNLEALPYYQEAPPKTLGTEWFESQMLPLISNRLLPAEDKLHTVVQHIASQVSKAVKDIGLRQEQMLASGGGVNNSFLFQELNVALLKRGIDLIPAESRITEYKEAIIFGFLGLFTLLGKPNILSSVTGADLDVCGGSIHLPAEGWDQAII